MENKSGFVTRCLDPILFVDCWKMFGGFGGVFGSIFGDFREGLKRVLIQFWRITRICSINFQDFFLDFFFAIDLFGVDFFHTIL